ncbi:BTAD domain-containing putative transcriptional regulator [Micromonospora sp. WMMD980]|uniref:BTAD domain-containing putative transcriptional regulator n=1 Tax=Micromonospora sp. WMMD980 TaxID=3016088 RepID=UPI00241771D3|nr:BTAD domain-containing putative transcriptional regulator [Micromonospora sp. WMMD980]MDG4803629.1 LysM peptidoglycan-binding domain-containing protein [Micromonospora sp. WMMD980]
MITTLSTVVRRIAAAAFSLLLLIGPPGLLLRFTESPLPERAPTWSTVVATLTGRLSDDMILTALTALLWAAWASFVWSLLAEIATALTGRRLPQPRALTPARGLATLLVTMITGSVLATAAHAATASPAAHARPAAAATATPMTDAHVSAARADTARTPSSTLTAAGEVLGDVPITMVSNGRQYTHTVKRGDTLSKIAEQRLGDADRWPEIFALNRGNHYPHVGGTLRDPNIIHPGWTLELPHDATPSTSRHRHRPAPPPAAVPTPTPTAPTPSNPPQTSAAAPTASNPAPAESTPTDDSSRPSRANRGVSLPTGSWIDVGLATAIIAAVTLVWAHRQRRYRPRTPTAARPAPQPAAAPIPRVIRQIRAGLRHDATATHLPQVRPAGKVSDAGTSDAAPHAGRGSDDTSRTAPVNAVGPTPPTDLAGLDDAPVAPTLAHPLSTVWPPAGLGLTGPGADAAARGFLTAALATTGDGPPAARPTVVIPASTAATLLGAAAIDLPRTPRLTVTADLDDALATLEHQALRRSRLVYDHEVDTVNDMRAADPGEEPLAPIMLLADASSRHGRTRISALLAQGQRLDIHGVFLGAWPDGDTAIVATDGTVDRAPTDARHGPHPADVGRLAVLNPAETVDLLATLAETHTGQPPAPAPVEIAPSPPEASHDPPLDTTATPRPDESDTHSPQPHALADDPDASSTAADPLPGGPATDVMDQPHSLDTDHHHHRPRMQIESAERETPIGADELPPGASDTHDKPTGRAEPDVDDPPHHDLSPWRTDGNAADGTPTAAHVERVTVTVLGRPTLVDASQPRTLRTKSLELLVYLAARDGTASTEEILEDLLPEAPSSRALHRLHTYVSDLRAVLRQHAGPGSYLTNPHQSYRLNPDRFDIDLWRLRAALRKPGNDPTRVPALRRAVEHYRPLAEDCDYEWLDAYRHSAQRESLDAVTALLDAYADSPSEQAAVCAVALPHHPYNEMLHQQAMRAHAALGDLDAVRALRRSLTQRLREIDAEPTEETLHLAHQLIDDARPQRRPRPSGGQPA